jgi:hypothetical protein
MSLFSKVSSIRAVPKATTTVPIVMADSRDNPAAGDTYAQSRSPRQRLTFQAFSQQPVHH